MPEADPPARKNPFAELREKLGAALPPGPAPSSAEPAAQQGSPPAAPPAPVLTSARVSVRFERAGRGGKTVTLAEGPGFAGRDLAPLAREAARAFGVGARVERGALVLQGDQGERLTRWLVARGFAGAVRAN
jgi:translation initiation factor 1